MKTKLLIILGLLAVIVTASFFIIKSTTLNKTIPLQSGDPTATDTHANQNFNELNKNIVHTALSKDSIPPIEKPEYISVNQVDYLSDNDKVFIYEAVEGTFIYPRKILVWHEIVNDTIDNAAVSITYCPLTGSVIGYDGSVELHEDNTFGTSGKLLNSNLVMYDRLTDSYIPQILGIAINNGLEGSELTTFPVYWADWADASAKYPAAKVLNISTGFTRDYFSDPYGTYDTETDDSYYTSGDPMFIVINPNDGTFTDKKVITGVKYQDYRVALDPDLIKTEKVYNFSIGDADAVAFYDEILEIVRVYRIPSDKVLDFKYYNGLITDKNDNVWNISGTSDSGGKLEHLTHFDVMWFAWYTYYPDTEVLN